MILLFFFSFCVSNAELEKQKQEVIIRKNLKRGNTFFFVLNYIINYMTIYTDQNKANFFPNVTLDKVENIFLTKDAI